jgi:hypothetical protein
MYRNKKKLIDDAKKKKILMDIVAVKRKNFNIRQILKPLISIERYQISNDLTSDSSSFISKTLRSTLMENPWFLVKSLVFHGTVPDTKDLTSELDSLAPIPL